jgi:hypothetical protein
MSRSSIFRSGKSQVAMEYMHTYGWIFVSALLLIGALYYYNVTHGDELIENSCIFLSGIKCLDVGVEDNLLSLVVLNGLGFSVSNISFAVEGTCNSTANTTDGNPYGNPVVLLSNQQSVFIFDCQNLTGLKLEENLGFSYMSVESGQVHVKAGSMRYYPGISG